MSRSGYSDDYDVDGTGGLWRGAVMRSIRGKRGQAALQQLAIAMDVMPVRKLAAKSLVTTNGDFCTLGVLGNARGLDMSKIDPYDSDAVSAAFNIAPAMACEIAYLNDESIGSHSWERVEICGPMRKYENHARLVNVPREGTAEMRWQYMRKWVAESIISTGSCAEGRAA